MQLEEKIKLFKDVFAPKSNETVLFLVDTPHGEIKDNKKWLDRRKMAKEWYDIFKKMGEENNFSVNLLEFDTVGVHNAKLPKDIYNEAKKSNLIIAMTEYSASYALLSLVKEKNNISRCASMPIVEKRMEDTALKANIKDVQKYALSIEKYLNKAIAAEVLFSTGDKLFIDLRNRIAMADYPKCTVLGDACNLPSGEGCIAPYEAVEDENEKYGKSKTSGKWPVKYIDEHVIFKVDNNKVTDVIGKGKNAEKMKKFFSENSSRTNVAELGIGCNPNAVITGNLLEDEKVGLHIAYGTSTHLNGKVQSDTHIDIVYAKGCPIEGVSVDLFNADGSKTRIIENSELRYNIL